MILKDLPEVYDKPIKKGCTIYLVRKISGHVTETTLEDIEEGPYVEVKFDHQHRYKLDLVGNRVMALDATIRHKEEMKTWWFIYEPQRVTLLALCLARKKDVKQKRKFGK